LLGLLEPDEGSVSIFGNDPAKDDAVRAMCGVLSEDVGLYEPLTVYGIGRLWISECAILLSESDFCLPARPNPPCAQGDYKGE
jgi:hypothetical protein